ncbi:Glycosyl transferases group 1 [Pirellula sp. SH-Sr6A]|nr:Glycosyl transferases group 1 [Pirellula sp. SH-Sr6A]
MFCGSCLHDNALAKELISLGHDCLLIPVYTPIRTDDSDVSIDRVFMGGVNVYLQQKFPWLAYTPKWLDSFLNQPWIIRALTKNAGKTSPKLLGPLTLSMLRGTQGRQRKEFLRMLEWLEADVRPDVVILTNLLIGGGIPDLRRRLDASIWVTLQGDDIFIDSLLPRHREGVVEAMRKLVPLVDGFIVHSRSYGTKMEQLLGIPAEKVHVIPLGIPTRDFLTPPLPEHDSNPKEPKRDEDAPFTIGYFARMATEKGLHRLVDAFVEIAKKPQYSHVRLKMAGWMGPQHEAYWNEQLAKLRIPELEGRWEYVGAIDRKEKTAFLQSIDLFCVPTVYEEPKALFLLEAIASGVPYVQPAHGAFPEIHARVHSTEGAPVLGRLFQPDAPDHLRMELIRMIEERTTRIAPTASLLEEIGIQKHAERVASLVTAKR